MKTDRELLLLAAKAIGVRRDQTDEVWYGCAPPVRPDWNPLTDAGDNHRLMVALNFQVRVCFEDFMHDREFAEVRWETADGREFQIREYGSDAHAVTRRAVVRAAAAIGEAMP